MPGWALILLLYLSRIACDESADDRNGTTKVSVDEETGGSLPQSVTEAILETDNLPSGESPTGSLTTSWLVTSRPTRRRPRNRRPRGYYNDVRYRNPANNPYNPHSPYAFRGRPGQPPVAYRQPTYSDPYYDAYNEYYGYPRYGQPVQQQYYPYQYQPQPQPQPQPYIPPTTEGIPDLYYVQKADGYYQYKKVSVVPDSYLERRRRPTRWSQQPAYGQSAPGYYNYPYDPYNKRPPPVHPQHNYYQPYQYQQQYQQPYYQYPRMPGGPRSHLRTGRPPVRASDQQGKWKLTEAPITTHLPASDPGGV